MNWTVAYLPEAEKDFAELDGSQRKLIRKAIAKVSQNPLSDFEGGLGKPLSNKRGIELAGFLKIKLKASGLRIVYKLERRAEEMLIVIIGARADEEVYELSQKRIDQHNLR